MNKTSAILQSSASVTGRRNSISPPAQSPFRCMQTYGHLTMLRQPINIAALTTSFFVVGLLTVVSFFGAWAYDEGTMSNSILASLFKIFRFPTHTLFGTFSIRPLQFFI